MPILVGCTSCGTQLQSADNTAGQAVRCPKCGFILRVPQVRVAPAAPPLSAAPPAPPPPAAPPPAAPRPALLDLVAGQAVCVHCTGRMVYDAQIAGRTVTCPQCRKPLHIPAMPAQSAPPPVPSAMRTAPPAPPPPINGSDGAVLRSPSRRRGGSDASAKALGLVGLLLGVAAFGCTVLPARFSWVSIPLGGLGVLLGLGGGVVALMRDGRALGPPVTATVIGAGALVVAVFYREAIAELMGMGPKKQVVAPARDDEWVDASKSRVSKDNVKVKVVDARVQGLRLPGVDPDKTPPGKFLFIGLEIENASEISKIEYEGWGSTKRKDVGARLKDNRDRPLQLVQIEGTQPEGQRTRGTVDATDMIEDVLMFEAPDEQADYLLLELPSAAYGGIGSLRLKIPADMIRR
jgi:hypothetical protein